MKIYWQDIFKCDKVVKRKEKLGWSLNSAAGVTQNGAHGLDRGRHSFELPLSLLLAKVRWLWTSPIINIRAFTVKGNNTTHQTGLQSGLNKIVCKIPSAMPGIYRAFNDVNCFPTLPFPIQMQIKELYWKLWARECTKPCKYNIFNSMIALEGGRWVLLFLFLQTQNREFAQGHTVSSRFRV